MYVTEHTMDAPDESLVKYDHPLFVAKKKDEKSDKPKAAAADISRQGSREILNFIFPPRELMEGNKLWVQQVSIAPSTVRDVICLKELLEVKLQQSQAMEVGLCPQRMGLYSQCFDELIRQITIICTEKGLLLLRVRDDVQKTFAAYQKLFESGYAFGMRKALQAEVDKKDRSKTISDLEEENEELKKEVNKLRALNETTEKRNNERRQTRSKEHNEEIKLLEKSNKQLKKQLEEIIHTVHV
uniref:Axonemal dynein light intermediate polypeptide 1 n=2 Tax=Gasterosteus aculeatus aculeatus TaxID=481459 RepID=G3PJC6_GASAC